MLTSERQWIRMLSRATATLLAMAICHAVQSAIDDSWKSASDLQKEVMDQFEDPKDCKALHRENRIWINRDEQALILDGYIAQRSVPLELFACPVGTKEHESIVAVFARPEMVHAGLLAINARPGSTVSFEPFKPAHGTTVRVYAMWLDDEGKTKSTLAQNWIRKSGTSQPMFWDWVFAGSKIYKDDEGKEHYLGNSGELISVSNFTTSTMDVAVRSEQSNASLLFEAFTERIPPKNTPVRLVLTLTDEAPYGSSDTDQDSENKKEPKYLSEKIPGPISKLLIGKKTPALDTKPIDALPSKSTLPNTKK
jgi:hypothetical protein